MKVLITGSSGWLGRYLAPLFRSAGYLPIGLDIVPSEQTSIIASVADKAAIEATFKEHRFAAIVHAGALHKPDISRYPQQAFIDTNVTGTLNLLEAASEQPGTRFVFTSTTSLMISQAIRNEESNEAAWLDEDHSPIEPRNIYGVTKLAAEALCRQHQIERNLPVIILRTSRFFPEEDDTHRTLSGPNMKANEFLNRRATVEDMARAHLTAVTKADEIGFGLYIVSAPTPFRREHTRRLKQDAARLIDELYPEAAALYDQAGWRLLDTIGRVYDGSRITRELGFEYETGFADVLEALRTGSRLPAAHDPDYVSPLISSPQSH